jgi:hypothetical protein
MSDTPQSIFEIYVHDDRYSVPTLHLLSTESEADARRVADALLDENAHHLGVELCRNGRLLVGLGALIETRRLRCG